MKKLSKLILAALGLALCVMTSAEAANSITSTVGKWQVTMTDLGVLPTGTASTAFAINNRSEIAGGANVAGDLTWEWRLPIWDANTGAVIGMAETSSAAVPAHRNDNGEMVGTDCVGDCGRIYLGYYWSPTGQIFALPALAGETDPFYSSRHTMANGINNVGQIVGRSKEGDPTYDTYAALWQNKDTLAQRLGSLGRSIYGMISSAAYGINDLTHVVGNSTVQSDSAIRAFLWRNGKMIDLGALSGQVVSEAYAINNNGLIAGKSNFYPVTWKYDVTNSSSAPAIQQLPIPSGFFSATPTAVNDFADVAGYAGSPNIDAHGILWRNGQAIDLGIWPGGHYSVANGINNLGQIVGTGTVAGDNFDHALMWTVAAAGGGGGGGTTNTTPSVSLKATSSTSIRVGGSLSVQASFTDPDNGPWSYKLDWGDGSATAGNASSAGIIPGISPHVYSKTGSFKAKLTVTDGKGAVGSSNTISVRVR